MKLEEGLKISEKRADEIYDILNDIREISDLRSEELLILEKRDDLSLIEKIYATYVLGRLQGIMVTEKNVCEVIMKCVPEFAGKLIERITGDKTNVRVLVSGGTNELVEIKGADKHVQKRL